MSAYVENQDRLLDLIMFFQDTGGYWDINQSEGINIEIRFCPFLGNKKGGMVEEIFKKRVYDINDYIKHMNSILEEYGYDGLEDL